MDEPLESQVLLVYLEQVIKGHKEIIQAAPIVVMDGNIPVETMTYILKICEEGNVPVWFEPTDVSRAFRPFQRNKGTIPKAMSYASPNFNELREMFRVIRPYESNQQDVSRDDKVLNECLKTGRNVLGNNLHSLVVTMGSNGVVLLTSLPEDAPFSLSLTPSYSNEMRAVHFKALTPEDIVSVSGAGDCLAGAMVGGILKGLTQHQCVQAGQVAATLSLASHLSVPETVTPDVFTSLKSDQIMFEILN